MRKITVEGIEINFNDLTEEKQKEIYEKNKKKYKQDASKSKYYSIRLAVVENETDSSKLLNIMMRAEIEGDTNRDLVESIFDNKIFKIEEETIKLLATSKEWEYRQKAAELSRDSKLLNEMLRNEVNGEQDLYVQAAILYNEIFEIEEETIKVITASENWECREKVEELISKDVNRLLKMFTKESKGGEVEILETILKNHLFEEEALLEYIRNNY